MYNGSLGGLSGADATCQGIANFNPLSQGGKWMAWLSANGTGNSVRERFYTSKSQYSAYPYGLLNGVLIADNWVDLTDGTIMSPININETGGEVSYVSGVITGTNESGGFKWDDCSGWTSAFGTIGFTWGTTGANDTTWTDMDSLLPTCNIGPTRLYCFEQLYCGDNVITSWLGEQCDDGNTISGDWCSSTCTIETAPCTNCGNNGGGNNNGGSGPTTPQCRDGRDNDADGKIDYANDTGCSSRDDNSEINVAGTGGCVENWGCSEYSSCVNGMQTRTCNDVNSCGTVSNKPVLQQACEVVNVNTSDIGAGGLQGKGNRALLGLSVYLLLVLTFIVTVIIVSLVVKEARMLKAVDVVLKSSMSTSQTNTEKNYAQGEVVSSSLPQTVSNAQMATFLVFVLTMAYYFVFVLAGFGGFGSENTGISLSPAFLAFGGFGIAFLVLVLALIVVVLSGIRMGKHHPKSKKRKR